MKVSFAVALQVVKPSGDCPSSISTTAKMLLPVHDSVLLEVPEELVEETRRVVVAAMETVPDGFAVPLLVDVKVGRTWAEYE